MPFDPCLTQYHARAISKGMLFQNAMARGCYLPLRSKDLSKSMPNSRNVKEKLHQESLLQLNYPENNTKTNLFTRPRAIESKVHNLPKYI